MIEMNGGVLEAHGGHGGLGQNGAFNGGASGGGRILIVGPVACAVPVTEALLAASAETISCPAPDLVGRDASGDQQVGLPTVVAEQQQAKIVIEPSFTFVAKDGEATVKISVDDPSSSDPDLDKEGQSQDNRAGLRLNPPKVIDPINDGRFTGSNNQTSLETNANGEAQVVFETTCNQTIISV